MFCMRIVALSLAVALVDWPGRVVRAAEPPALGTVTRPAAFTESPRSLQKRIRFPPVEGDVFVRLDCDAAVSRKGTVRYTYCFAPDSRFVRFERAIATAASYAVIAPAMTEGVPHTVWFQYRVEFERRGPVEDIRVYPNQGLQVATFGTDYSAPQRLNDRFPESFWERCPLRTKLWVTATVSEEGRSEAVSVEANGQGIPECRAALLNLIQRSRFIPAFAGGQPVRAHYREMFYSPSAARAIGFSE